MEQDQPEKEDTEIGGPFVDQKFHDVYKKNSGLRWALWIIIFIGSIGFIAYLVVILNASPIHTYFKNPDNTLFSQRYTNITWIFTMLTVFSIPLTLVSIMMMIMYRRNFGCSVFWLTFFALWFLVQVFSIAIFGSHYSSCNTDDQPFNICNDPLYCCVPSYRTNVYNMCPNSSPCGTDLTPEQLRPDNGFLWLFWVNTAYLVMTISLLLLVLALWFNKSIGIQRIHAPPPLPSAPQQSDLGSAILQKQQQSHLVVRKRK